MKAFPEAEGYGRLAKGGRGGEVYHVTTLADSGPGSLRDACVNRNTQNGDTIPRTVIFRVGGTITLDSSISINTPFLTLAGQTAPNQGVMIRTKPGKDMRVFTISGGAHDVVVRYMRLRNSGSATDAEKGDCVEMSSGSDIILDHCSMSWGTDENFATWGTVDRVTVQWSIMAEGIDGHSKGALFGNNPRNISFHMNLLASNEDRNPWYKRTVDDGVIGTFSMVNNVVYNWDFRAAYFGWFGICPEYPEMDGYSAGTRVNMIGNFFKTGPNTSKPHEISLVASNKEDLKIYLDGNYGPNRTSAASDEWGMTIELNERCGTGITTQPAPTSYRSTTSFDSANLPPPISAQAAYTAVLAGAGATLPVRDAVDTRIVQEVESGTGGIPTSTPSMPTYATGTPYPDADEDGMDDTWEAQNGLSSMNAADRNGDLDGDGYTNLEEFLNGTSP